MSTQAPPRATRPWSPAVRGRAALDALDHIVGGLGTAVLAAIALLWLLFAGVLCLVGVGLFLLPSALRLVRMVADRERARLSRWGPEILGAEPVPAQLGDALRQPTVLRELGWTGWHATLGMLFSLVALTLPIDGLHDLLFPVWWKLAPPSADVPSQNYFTVHDWPGAFLVCLIGFAALVITVLVLPVIAWAQAWSGRRLLVPDDGTDLALRVAELKATRAAALDAHAAELRRIERSLHDGTQNRLVAVTVLIGAANRALARDPNDAREILDRAQDAAEQALAELRGVVRSILPPVLTARSLPDALTGLAADCVVPCEVDAEVPDRCAASVEATLYFVVAEALTNIARHSGAGHATVRLRRRDERLCVDITDDGHGGADGHGGSGLTGIRRRVEAHDGTFALSSPVGGPTVLTASVPCGL
ncbi:sensor domain-containing protein [Amycolatopsis acidiphila]|uniref:histidine kinase n=1 Tax=Amycolatopsis acidiphila TaxID=715473 RepID=A0A558AHV2_9PSEU|nr:sensor domain-containing protein [Amycolatopsis acidiphila]TVT23827.1 sensor histidine kinase [Amycolatopsis acidiphila]UIJ61196.1 sensor domain-containing protein [Amycolatopsis acidiphila]GHG97903.1 histidine kinase [Amycolatopsis acidiphila]